MSVNKVILVGNVGKDPEVKYLDNGVAVCNFSLATSETYSNKNGEKVTQTEWHNIVLWRKLAEIAETYIKKGMQIYIEGQIRTRNWEDKDGVKRYTTEIFGTSMQMLGRKAEGGNEPQANQEVAQHTTSESPAIDETDDLPF
jgi:single-strand DNA-binding protein